MTMKGKKAKIQTEIDNLSPDISVRRFIEHKKELDVLIWYKSGGGVLAIPYLKNEYLECKLWFPSLLKMNEFCMRYDRVLVFESEN